MMKVLVQYQLGLLLPNLELFNIIQNAIKLTVFEIISKPPKRALKDKKKSLPIKLECSASLTLFICDRSKKKQTFACSNKLVMYLDLE